MFLRSLCPTEAGGVVLRDRTGTGADDGCNRDRICFPPFSKSSSARRRSWRPGISLSDRMRLRIRGRLFMIRVGYVIIILLFFFFSPTLPALRGSGG